MQEIFRSILLIILPFTWIAFPILTQIAVSKLTFLYDEDTNKAGFKLKKRTWGPSYKDTKKILKLTNDEYTLTKAKKSIRLWRIGYNYLYISIILWLVIVFLQ